MIADSPVATWHFTRITPGGVNLIPHMGGMVALSKMCVHSPEHDKMCADSQERDFQRSRLL